MLHITMLYTRNNIYSKTRLQHTFPVSIIRDMLYAGTHKINSIKTHVYYITGIEHQKLV